MTTDRERVWHEAELQLREVCIGPALHAALNDEMLSVYAYNRGYDLVYDLCLNKPRSDRFFNAQKCYEFIECVAEENVMPTGLVRLKFLTFMKHIFRIVDRFYSSWHFLPEVFPMMEQIMDMYIVSDLFRVRSLFKLWAYNDSMLSQRFHPDGSYAKRICAKYSTH